MQIELLLLWKLESTWWIHTVADSEFHLGTGSQGGPSRDQTDWERGADQRDGRSASKFAIP
jgi:hypothetical protein